MAEEKSGLPMRAGAALVGIPSPGTGEPKWPTFQEMTACALGGAPPVDPDPQKEGTRRVETLRVFCHLLLRHSDRQPPDPHQRA